MAAFVVICFGYLSGNMVVVLGLQRKYLRYALFGLIFNVALNVALLPPVGFMAAAWVTLATEVLVVGLGWRAVLRELRFRPRLDRVWRALLATAAMTGLLLVLRVLDASAVVLIAAALVSYPLLALASRAVTLDELRELRAVRQAQA
jgi:O-antigen/teichoic acid export membrane protein